jgi:hypothetical protein
LNTCVNNSAAAPQTGPHTSVLATGIDSELPTLVVITAVWS